MSSAYISWRCRATVTTEVLYCTMYSGISDSIRETLQQGFLIIEIITRGGFIL